MEVLVKERVTFEGFEPKPDKVYKNITEIKKIGDKLYLYSGIECICSLDYFYYNIFTKGN